MAIDVTNLPNSIYTNMKQLLTDADVGGTTYDITYTGVYPKKSINLDEPLVVISSETNLGKDNIGDNRLKNKTFIVLIDVLTKTAVAMDSVVGDILYSLETNQLADTLLVDLNKTGIDLFELGNTKGKITTITATYKYRG